MIKLIKSTFYRENATKKALCNFIKKAEILSLSKQCIEFEHSFAKWQNRKYCVVVNSGSSANLAIIQALLNLGYINKNDKVGFSAVTWSTNVMPLIQLGLQPVPVDVSLATLNISPETLLTALKTTKIKMLFLTNLLGFCDRIDEIADICRRKKIIIIEDTCESLGTVYKGQKLGNFGLASTFSFYVGHHMSTIEGGAVCTDDEELATMVSLVRAHGWDRNLEFARQEAIRKKFRINSTFYSRYTFYDSGYNFRPTEITGFLGLNQMQYLPKIITRREKNFKKIARAIYSQTDKYYPIKYDHIGVISNFAVPVICKSRSIRDDLVKKCDGLVEIRPVVGGNMTKQPFFTKYLKSTGNKYPNADLIHEQGLYFGNNPDLTSSEIDLLVKTFSFKK